MILVQSMHCQMMHDIIKAIFCSFEIFIMEIIHHLLIPFLAIAASFVVLFLAAFHQTGIIAIAILAPCFFLLFQSENQYMKKASLHSEPLTKNHRLRIIHMWLCVFSFQWALLFSFAGIAGHINYFFYNLNLIAICSYLPIALIIIWISRKLEARNKIASAKKLLMIPFLNYIISFICAMLI